MQRLKELFTDPITYEVMQNPVINTCGHSFDRESVADWIQQCDRRHQPHECPLCRAPINLPLPNNIILQHALEVLDNPENRDVGDAEQLIDDDERKRIEIAVSHINDQRARNAANDIPNELPQQTTFSRRAEEMMGSCRIDCF
jgi:hypothetical protein